MREQQLLTTKDSDTLNIMTICTPLGVMSSFRDILELYIVRCHGRMCLEKKGGGGRGITLVVKFIITCIHVQVESLAYVKWNW